MEPAQKSGKSTHSVSLTYFKGEIAVAMLVRLLTPRRRRGEVES